MKTTKKEATPRKPKPRPRATKPDGESEVLANIAAMLPADRVLAERLHAIIHQPGCPILVLRASGGQGGNANKSSPQFADHFPRLSHNGK